MIDFHCHILPEIDDGSADVGETAALLEMEKEQGVTDIIFTPHFYAEQQRLEKFLTQRNCCFEQTAEIMRQKGLGDINTYLGAEVCYFQGIGQSDILSALCIDESSVMLLELPFFQWNHMLIEDLQHLIHQKKIKVVIAHMERYYRYQQKKDIWNQVLQLPVFFQLNAGPFLEKWTTGRLQFKLLNRLDRVVLGSDCHNTVNRRPNLQPARKLIERKAGIEQLQQIDQLGRQLIELIQQR